jgi:predicted transcriptional regulator
MDFCTVESDENISVLTDLFRRYKVCFIVTSHGKSHTVHDVITKIDLIDYIASRTGSAS